MDRHRRMHRHRRLPRLVAHGADRDALGRRLAQRHAAPVAGDDVALGIGRRQLDLQPLGRTVGVARRAADRAGLAQHMPGLQRLAELELDALVFDLAAEREAELAPAPRTSRSGRRSRALSRSASTSRKSSQTKCGSMNRSCSDEPQRGSGPSSGSRHSRAMMRADQQLLGEAHARVRRHLEAAELDQAEPAGRAVGRIELVDADFRAMGVAGHVGEEVAHQAVEQPRRGRLSPCPGAGSARARSRVRRGCRGAPRRCAAPGWSGR